MEIEIRDEMEEASYVLHVGDIIWYHNWGCGVVKQLELTDWEDEIGKYVIESLDSDRWLCGSYESLEKLTDRVVLLRDDYKIYRQSEYKLVLERK